MGIKVMINTSTIENFTAPFKFDEGNQNISQISKVSLRESAYNITFLNTNSLEVDEIPSLEEFLSNLICRGCSKMCPLIALRCSNGIKYREAAIEEYNATYTNATLNTESSASESNEDVTEKTGNDSSSAENTITEIESDAADNSILESSTTNNDTDESESTQESVVPKNSDTNKSTSGSTSKSITKSTITNKSNEIEPESRTPESNKNESDSSLTNDNNTVHESDQSENSTNDSSVSDLPSDKENLTAKDRFSEFSLSDDPVVEDSQSNASPMDFVSIMGLFIAATHYTIKSSEKKKTGMRLRFYKARR